MKIIENFLVNHKILIATLSVLVLFFLGWGAGNLIPEQIDWVRTYRPATQELLNFHSPYSIKTFFNPPWILIPLIPFALLPDHLGNGLLFIVSLVSIVYTCVRFGARPVTLIAFVFSFPVVFLLLFGQIDWMILLAFVFPPQIGLFFILAKPQIAIPYVIFLFVELYQSGGIKLVIKTFYPVTLAYGLSFLIFGFWPAGVDTFMVNAIYDYSLWPGGLIIGLPLLVYSLLHENKRLSILASPFFSPYVGAHSWSIPMLPFLPYKWEMIVATVGSWIMCYLRL